MTRLNVVELRAQLAEVLNRAEYRGERVVIHRREKDAAAIVPIEDLRLLERLVAEAEDRIDAATAREALAEPDDRVPYSRVRTELGLSDEPGQGQRGTASKRVRGRDDPGRGAGARRPAPRRAKAR